SPVSSLRRRLMLGAALWTFGLMAAVTTLLTVSPAARQPFVSVHAHGVMTTMAAIICMIAGLAVVRSALAPLDEIRRRRAGARDGRERQVRGEYPAEVRPLVDDLNALLAHTEQAVARANAKAGDLAHGLKTPLAVLSNEADHLGTHGNAELAST